MTIKTVVVARCDACLNEGESYHNELIVETEADVSEVVDVRRRPLRCACADPDCLYDYPNLLGLVRERRREQRRAA